MRNKNILMYQERIGCTIDALAKEIENIASRVTPNPIVTFRMKNSKTLQRKMVLLQVKSVFLIHDVYGIRIIVKSVEEAYMVLSEVSRVLPGQLTLDYFKKPKKVLPAGSKTIQFLKFVAFRNDALFEIQITTKGRHVVNEAQHEQYHRKKYSQIKPAV